MSSIPEVLNIIDGEYDEWVPLKQIADDAKIANTVKTLSCDTRDFALGWNFKRPEPFKRAECGLEVRTNDGLARARRIEQSRSISDYLIDPDEIVPWLKKLCEKTGGYDEDWRFLTANVKGCTDWDIKYIRFVHHDSGRFMVCNAYWHPIKWRNVLGNISRLNY